MIFRRNRQDRKNAKNAPKRPKIITLSFYCITLALFCQVSNVLIPTEDSSVHAENVNIRAESPINAVNQFHFQDFTADYYLSKSDDGTSRLKVVEQFIAIFPESDQNHGLVRIIPYTNQDGKNLTMASDTDLDITIKHNGITENPYKIEPGDGHFTVYLGNPDEYVHGRQIYQLEYEFKNVIFEPADHPTSQELYWDANGNDWSQSFDQVVARVHLVGDDVKSAFTGQTACYVGSYGAQNSSRCTVQTITDGIEFRTAELSPHENLTFDLEFQNGTFALPRKIYDYRMLIATVVVTVVAVFLLGAIFIIHYQTKTKRVYYHSLFVTPEYAPPKGFTVAEMDANYARAKSVLVSNKVATLMELAVTGKIILTKVGTEKHPQWTVKILRDNFTAEQIAMLQLLAGKATKLSVGQEILIRSQTANQKLIQLDRDFSEAITKRLYDTGLYEPKYRNVAKLKNHQASINTKSTPCDFLMVAGILWTIICVIALPFLFDGIPSYITLYGGGLLIAVLIILAITIAVAAFWASHHYQKFYLHTKKGLKLSRYLDGLKLYIKMAEQDRLKLLQSVKGVDTSNQGIAQLYEKLLPYAVIFHLETSWTRTLGKYYELDDVRPPQWYLGGAAFSAHEFSRAIHSVSSATISSIHSGSSDSSSSFSGASGGGFSGGGGGGGGGGGW